MGNGSQPPGGNSVKRRNLGNELLAFCGIMLACLQPVCAQEEPLLEWLSTYTEQAPVLDGEVDAVWERAVPLTVTVREALGGVGPREVILRALHTDADLYVLAQWPDDTESILRDPYIWNSATSAYDRPTLADDQFALEFPLEGEFTVSMLPSGLSYVTDVWHWKAGRSNLDGWVDDKRHIISTTPVEGALPYQMGGREVIYIARPMDSGMQSYATVPLPTVRTEDVVSSYSAQQPDSSQADIRGKGLHDGARWTLEMGRKFNTGYADDAVLDANHEIFCAIAILDDELYWNHSVSPKLVLRFQTH